MCICVGVWESNHTLQGKHYNSRCIQVEFRLNIEMNRGADCRYLQAIYRRKYTCSKLTPFGTISATKPTSK